MRVESKALVIILASTLVVGSWSAHPAGGADPSQVGTGAPGGSRRVAVDQIPLDRAFLIGKANAPIRIIVFTDPG